MKTFIIILVVVAFLTACYLYYRRHPRAETLSEQEPEVLDGELKMSDVVAYFKTLMLRRGVDVPFVADLRHAEVVKMLDGKALPQLPEDGRAILLGVYQGSMSAGISHVKIILCCSIDQRIADGMAGSGLVVLS